MLRQHLPPSLPNHNLDGDLVAPSGVLVGLLPRPDSVDLEYVLALLIDFDAFGGNGPPKYDGHEVILDRALLEIGDVETCDVSAHSAGNMIFFNRKVREPYHRCPRPSARSRL